MTQAANTLTRAGKPGDDGIISFSGLDGSNAMSPDDRVKPLAGKIALVVSRKSGQAFSSWRLASEYGFTDMDGRRPDWGKYCAGHFADKA